jgi:tetratricopeptide (TPR) repeat protein
MKLETSLIDLEQAQLVRRVGVSDAPLLTELGGAYQFRHTLTQEAAYRSLPRRLRQQVHRQVAACYEELFADRLDDHAATLAQHYAEAGDAGKAVDYSRRAGDAAMRLFATAEAISHYSRAISLIKTTSTTTEEIVHLYNRRGRCCELENRFGDALESYQEMERLAHERGDVRLNLAALMAQARLYSTVNPLFNPSLGRARAESALQLAKDLEDQRAQAETYWNLMNQVRFGEGPFSLAVEYGEQAMNLARAAQWNEQLAFILNDLADVYFENGQMDKGRDVAEEAQILFRAVNNLPMLADNLCVNGTYYCLSGEFDKALNFFEEALTISRRLQNEWTEGFALGWRGMAGWFRGDYGAAMKDYEAGATLADRAGFLIGQFLPRIMLALIYAELGEYGEATQRAFLSLEVIERSVPQFAPIAQSVIAYLLTLTNESERAASFSRMTESPDQAAGLYTYHFQNLAQMELALWNDQPERALALNNRHHELFEKNQLISLFADVLFLRGRALVALGRNDDARSVLDQARIIAHEKQLRRVHWQILAVLANLALTPEDAQALRAEASQIINTIADSLPSDNLRATFLAKPEVHQVLTQ